MLTGLHHSNTIDQETYVYEKYLIYLVDYIHYSTKNGIFGYKSVDLNWEKH